MFTGLVEEVGLLQAVTKRGEAMVLHIRAAKVLEGMKIGDSIAVNGVCLTAVSYDSGSFMADVMPETFRHTNLKDLQPGAPVNLERAMAADGRFGGHIVQGHVDGLARIMRRTAQANAVVFEFLAEDPGMAKYMIPRGSVTVDGISLTLTRAEEGVFAVSIIPHTLAETALHGKQPGDTVNIECDVLAKYVDHLLAFGSRSAASGSSRISSAFLAEHGFM
ncbi:riboflavin synthase [Paenibacillus thiaminolyticus]|uniref:riboflavin synthase n=1 Tax=Paenibacillus thiaminolyticus TaxID=49283 RepID=UPI00232FB416|nr:riboflavin synthase [Paenibacillus thiaminolyticus]WCF06269.1 riboflavin synthase [Paenibacillus thiaminolyticus]WII35610.1 riboflavin synthase [Paenibacillus thiaminolyticus]